MNKVKLKKGKWYFIESLQTRGQIASWKETPTSTKVTMKLPDGDSYETHTADLSK